MTGKLHPANCPAALGGVCTCAGTEPDKTDGGLVDEVIPLLERWSAVAEWPEDEQALFRAEGWRSFDERSQALLRLRARKVIQLVAGHLGDLPRPRVDGSDLSVLEVVSVRAQTLNEAAKYVEGMKLATSVGPLMDAGAEAAQQAAVSMLRTLARHFGAEGEQQ
jgi:hypothetical protein